MLVTEAAQFLNTTPAKLINELTRKYKGVWNKDSEVPEEFVETAERIVGEYIEQTTPQIEGHLTVAEAAAINQEAIEYAILEALNQVEIPSFYYSGQVQGMMQIEAVQNGKADVWAKHYERQNGAMNGHLDTVKKQVEAFLPAAKKRQSLKGDLNRKTLATQRRLSNLPKLM